MSSIITTSTGNPMVNFRLDRGLHENLGLLAQDASMAPAAFARMIVVCALADGMTARNGRLHLSHSHHLLGSVAAHEANGPAMAVS